MIRTGRKKEWSILLFVVSLVALMPPLIALFDISDSIFGVPLSYLYLFSVWGGMIALTALGARRGSDKMVGPPEAGKRKTGANPSQGR
ncbi:hypothetical protein GQF03_06305 [Sneathiella chungangensis]|uniref:DUF3311 domain-containing protein n=1 Tax=Sneathiella chungangensis TaxID=1418234 RepID=A0A845MFB0_9PROT|nr:hypothetical protein [Sneathiella chungangensis]MZR21937.1 hypothetical protein [Sneathiella chungangensis]